MEREPEQRYWRVVLVVEQNPYVNDIPLQWDWEYMLGGRAELLECEEVTDKQNQSPKEDE